MPRKLYKHFQSLCVVAVLAGAIMAGFAAFSRAAAPGIISYQGRVQSGGNDFNGTGQFKFALVDGAGTITFWSNDGSSTTANEPTAAVSLTVTKGLYSVLLGDASITNMTVIPASVFSNNNVKLRIWFNDGTNGSQQLAPDQRISAVGYALVAAAVDDGTVTTAKIADGAVTTAKIAEFPKARVYSDQNQNLPPGTTVLSFNQQRYNFDNIHDRTINNTRLTCNTAGVYVISGTLRVSAGVNCSLSSAIRLNGTTYIADELFGVGTTPFSQEHTITTQYYLNKNDYIELLAGVSDTTSTLTAVAAGNYSPEFMMAKLP